MWPFRKKTGKRNKIIDKVLMGAVIGGAIGSVIGASLPKKENTKVESGKPVSRIRGFFRKKEAAGEKKKIPHEEI